jgi:hypothetical protein
MKPLKEFFIVLLSSVMGAFFSGIFPILANRRFSNQIYAVFWSNWIYLLIFGILLICLAFVLRFMKD